MTLQEILSTKGTAVFTILPQATLAEAVRELTRHNVGALLVCIRDPVQGEQLAGIITERDLLHWCAASECNLAAVTVAELMSTKLVTAAPSDTVAAIMGVMTERRIRHVPVVVNGRLVGIVSIGDLIKAQHDHLAAENRYMRDYIQG